MEEGRGWACRIVIVSWSLHRVRWCIVWCHGDVLWSLCCGAVMLLSCWPAWACFHVIVICGCWLWSGRDDMAMAAGICQVGVMLVGWVREDIG
jgi:hypothetical protein